MDIMENEPLYAPDAANPGQITVAATSITPHTSASAAEEEEVEVVAEEVEVEPMTAEQALAAAAAEGLTLERSNTNTGFKGVSRVAQPFKHGKQFWASHNRGKTTSLGYYATAEEAALVVARATQASAAAPPPQGDALVGMTVEVKWSRPGESYFAEVLSYDAAESAPYYVRYKDDGLEQNETLAAADFGRGWWLKKTPKAWLKKPAASAAPVSDDHHMTEAEADRRAAEEGLVLLRADGTLSGFKGVQRLNQSTTPYRARVCLKGKSHIQKSVGPFCATPWGAALEYARAIQRGAAEGDDEEEDDDDDDDEEDDDGDDDKAGTMTATEARRLAAQEGLTLVESKVSKSKFMNVYVDPSKRTKPFFAQPSLNGRPTSLGYFATAEEAALTVARAKKSSPTSPAAASTSAAAAPAAPKKRSRDDAVPAEDDDRKKKLRMMKSDFDEGLIDKETFQMLVRETYAASR